MALKGFGGDILKRFLLLDLMGLKLRWRFVNVGDMNPSSWWDPKFCLLQVGKCFLLPPTSFIISKQLLFVTQHCMKQEKKNKRQTFSSWFWRIETREREKKKASQGAGQWTKFRELCVRKWEKKRNEPTICPNKREVYILIFSPLGKNLV
jgi:hypothetical protein